MYSCRCVYAASEGVWSRRKRALACLGIAFGFGYDVMDLYDGSAHQMPKGSIRICSKYRASLKGSKWLSEKCGMHMCLSDSRQL